MAKRKRTESIIHYTENSCYERDLAISNQMVLYTFVYPIEIFDMSNFQ
jgi:hypothetical protein